MDEIIDLDQRTDEQVFEAYRKGEAAGLRVLIERHKDELLRFLIRLVGDRAAAEDVFQEAFLQVHLAAESFDTSRRFRPWLFTIAANKGRDYLRKKGRRHEAELSAPVGGSADSGGASFVDLMEIDIPAPTDRMERAEQERKVQEVLSEMPLPLREILLLAYFQRLSYAQIADDLDIPLGTVKSRLHSAVAQFARRWNAHTNGRVDA